MIPDLIHLSEINGYIGRLTGTLVSDRAIRRRLNDGSIPILVLPSDRRKKYTRAHYLNEFIKQHSQKDSDRRPTEAEVLNVKPVKKGKDRKRYTRKKKQEQSDEQTIRIERFTVD